MESKEQCLAAALIALNTKGFSDALIAWVNTVLPNDNIALLGYFQDRAPELFLAQSNTPEVHARLESSYLNGAYLLDPLHQLHVTTAPPGVYRLKDIAPDHFARNRYYIDYYVNTTMVDEIAFVSYPNTGVTLQLCLGRDKKSGRKFTAHQIKTAHEIFPIVSALLNRHWSSLNSIGSFDEKGTVAALKERADRVLDVQLTQRQAEIVFLILKGHSSNSVALHLGIAYQTVKVFRRQVFKKCQISSQAELFSMFVPLLGIK
nr:helix-turn-helix transcriptional regulator [uncultured Shimia sp.]